MDNILERLLTLIDKGTVEHRCASLLVLTALKVESAQIVKIIAAILDQPNPVLKDFALRYFEEVQPKAAASLMSRFLDDPEKEIQERTVRLLSRAGETALQPLLQSAPAASRAWQLNAARVLCAIRGKAALKALLQMLATGADDFNKTICDLMTPWIREMDAKEQESLYNEIEKFAAKLDVKQQRPAGVSSIRLTGQLGRPQARKWLFGFVGREHHPALRSHALAALLHCLGKEDLRKDEYAKLFSVLEETEFSEVSRLALDLLDAHDLPEDSRATLSRLMGSPHGAVQQFALRKMGDFGTPATVRTLIEQLGDPDYRRRDIAAHSLHKIPEARAALIKELLACEDPSKAWSIAELLPFYEGKWRQDNLAALWKRLHGAIEAEDRIQNSFMHVLKKADADFVYERLSAEGAKLFKAKKYKEAIPFFTPLKEFAEFKSEHKFLLALSQLKAHPQRPQPAVELLIDVYRNSAFPLLESLKKEKKLEPGDIFSLGFTFAERPGDERDLGKGLLEHVVARVPRTKIGKSAKNKLKLLKG